MNKWSEELPQELLILIFNRFTVYDIARLGSVCKSWRLVSKRSMTSRLKLPWLMMLSNPNCENHEKEEEERSYFNLSDNTTFSIKFPQIRRKRCCGSFNNSGGWLMTVDEKLEVQLFHPWKGIQLQLPHSSTFPLQYYRDVLKRSDLEIRDTDIRKAAMSDDGKTIMFIYNQWDLALCRIGDRVWTGIKSRGPPKKTMPLTGVFYVDVIYHKGKFYTLAETGSIAVCHIDTDTPHDEVLIEELEGYDCTQGYLVADTGSESLFVVTRNGFDDYKYENEYATHDFVPIPFKTSEFDVYEIGLDEKGKCGKNPVKVENLGDRIMFLGHNSSMLVRASEFPGWKGNCIYFTDDNNAPYLDSSPEGCLDLGVFSMEDGTVERLFQNRAHPTFSPPIWITPPHCKEES